MKVAACCVAALTIVGLSASSASCAPDVAKLLTQADVEAALGAKVTTTTKQLPAPLGGNQITYTSTGIPVKTFAITVRTDDGLAPSMKSAGYTVGKLFQSDKAMGTPTALVVKGGDGFSSMTRSEIFKNGILLSATTLFGSSKEAQAIRNALLLKAAEHL
jgi:hypothetical protein